MRPIAKHKHGVTAKQEKRLTNVERRRQAAYETDPYMARQQELLRLDLEYHRLDFGSVKVVW